MNFARGLVLLVLVPALAEEPTKLRNRLYGKHLVVTMGNIPPSSNFIRNSTGHVVAYSGNIYELFVWLSKRLHFSYTIVPMFENVVGRYVNGSYTGIIGQLARHEHDLSLGPFAPSHERFGAIDFVVYIGSSSTWLLVKYPEARLSDSAVFEPYTPNLWLIWFSSMVAVGLAALSLVYVRTTYLAEEENRFQRIDAMFMYLFGTVSGQGGYYRSGHRSIGLIAGIWCFTAFFFIIIYNSILTSRLSAHYQFPDVKSLEELANKPNFQLATLRGSIWEIELMNAKNGTMGILGGRFRKCPDCSVVTVPELAQKPLKGNYISYLAFSYAAGMVDKDYEVHKKCRLTIGNINYGWQYSFMGIARRSPYAEELHRESLWAKAFGFSSTNTNWPDIGYRFPHQCILKYNSRGVAIQQYNVPIKLFQLSPAFILLTVGHVTAMAIFLLEKLVFYLRERLFYSS